VEKEDLIINLLRENRADVKEVKEDISEMKIEVALNRQDLEEHMEQTRAVKSLALEIRQEAQARLEKLESKYTFKYIAGLLIKAATGIGIVSGAIYGVLRLFE
jgi:ribosome recycling factor